MVAIQVTVAIHQFHQNGTNGSNTSCCGDTPRRSFTVYQFLPCQYSKILQRYYYYYKCYFYQYTKAITHCKPLHPILSPPTVPLPATHANLISVQPDYGEPFCDLKLYLSPQHDQHDKPVGKKG